MSPSIAQMDLPAAAERRDALQKELNEINRLPLPKTMEFFIFPKLVNMEIFRLNEDIWEAFASVRGLTKPHDTKIPVEGASMLSRVPAAFNLSSAEATEMFQKQLSSELDELKTLAAKVPLTLLLMQNVLHHTEPYLKKQRRHDRAVFGPKDHERIRMDYKAARVKRDRLQDELDILRFRARAVNKDLDILLKLMNAEVDRVSEDVQLVRMAMRISYIDIKIPVEGAHLLSRVPDEYGLSCAAKIKEFRQKLNAELKWVMTLTEQFPLTFQFVQRVIGHADRYLKEKRPYEEAVFGCTGSEKADLVKQCQNVKAVSGHSDDQTGTKRKFDAAF